MAINVLNKSVYIYEVLTIFDTAVSTGVLLTVSRPLKQLGANSESAVILLPLWNWDNTFVCVLEHEDKFSLQ